MQNWFEVTTAVLIMVGGLIHVLAGFWRTWVERRFVPRYAANIALGFAFVVLMWPSVLYPSLALDRRDPFLWVSAALLVLGVIFEIVARRRTL